MSLVVWIVLASIAGFLAGQAIGRSGARMLVQVAAGIAGAVGGGFLVSLVRAVPINGLDVYGVFVATVSALLALEYLFGRAA